MRNIAVIVATALLLASATADSYQEAYADSRGPADTQSAKLSDRSPTATGSGAVSPGVVYGSPVISQPSPAPIYGVPIRQQYGPPAQLNTGSQYGAPFPVYGPPTSLPSTSPTGPVPDQGLPFNFDILGFLSNIPLPDIHSVLKIIFKITLLKAVIKVVSLFALLLFAPKLEDIFNMIGMMTGIANDVASSDTEGMPTTMNDTADDDTDTTSNTANKPSSRLRAAKEMRLDRMARQLHDSINKTAQELACRGEHCGHGLDSQTDGKSVTATSLITRMLHTLTGIPDSKKKPVAKNLKKSLKAVTAS